jgi:septum formation topological specificity factor MinE
MEETEKIEIITRQTNYTHEEASKKLMELNSDHMEVIKQYYGIPSTKKKLEMKSYNQEIYRQIREKLKSVSTSF